MDNNRSTENYSFSILIPSWNNLTHLQLCIRSLKENSSLKNQIIVFVNEGKDGTVEWIQQQEGIDYLHSENNVGVCIAMNSCRRLVRANYIVYLNDDMYACPDWDLELLKEIERIGHDRFMLSATAIEPYPTTNPNLFSIVRDFGDSVDSFQEDRLLKEYKKIHQDDWSGSSWPPSVVSLATWDTIGGYSIEFSPGMYSDPDFSMKLWKYGVRIFKGVGKSKVYHFQSKSTKRLKKNKGSNTFLMKWGITAKVFYSHYLKMGKPFDQDALYNPERLPTLTTFRVWAKRAFLILFKSKSL